MQDSSFDNKSFVQNELLKISRIMSLATPKSLLLIDEFGRGTNHLDAICLQAALINTLDKGLYAKSKQS